MGQTCARHDGGGGDSDPSKHKSPEDDKLASRRSMMIDSQLREEQKGEQKVIRLLLLGTGGCGKSTLLKQMRLIHGEGFDPEEIERNKQTIRSNIVQQMALILSAMERFHVKLERPQSLYAADHIKELGHRSQTQQQQQDAVCIPAATVRALHQLWGDPGVRAMAARGSQFNMNESAPYYFDNLDRIATEEYVPTEQDILLNRVCTLGIVQIPIQMKNADFIVYDVGGQRTQRRKWIHCFDRVSVVIFMAAMSEFDQVLDEDDTTNRMLESIAVFDSICNSMFFVSASMLLFLNKRDLFLAKIQAGKSIKSLFELYEGTEGPDSYNDQATYLTEKFLERKHNVEKMVYTHQVCATDTNQVQIVLNSALDTILSKFVLSSGM